MYSRKKIPAPFGKTQKTAEKKKEATRSPSPKGNLKRAHFSSRGGKNNTARRQLACACTAAVGTAFRKKDASPACIDNRML